MHDLGLAFSVDENNSVAQGFPLEFCVLLIDSEGLFPLPSFCSA